MNRPSRTYLNTKFCEEDDYEEESSSDDESNKSNDEEDLGVIPVPEQIERALSNQLEGVQLDSQPEPERTEPERTEAEQPEQTKTKMAEPTTDQTKNETTAKAPMPKRFNGNRNTYQAFRDAIDLFFILEDKYSTDQKKIAFVLALLDEGEARTWRTNFLRKKRISGATTYGTYDDFLKTLDTSFKRQNEEDEALFNLHRMRQKSDETAEQLITRFREQASLAGLDIEATPRLAIDYLKDILNPSLVDKISLDVNEPTSFEEWVKLVIKYDNVWRRNRILRAMGRRGQTPRPNNFKAFSAARQTTPKKDPDAMDVDTLSVEEKNRLLASGACFRCKERGHLSKNCPKKGKGPATNTWQKGTPADAARYIRSILAQFSPEEEAEIFKIAEAEDDSTDDKDFQ